MKKSDEYFMKEALKEAKKALLLNEIPVGAVIVKDDKIIARGYNKKETLGNALAHAEIIAINKASKKIGNYRLNDTKIYVTLEPCIMCMGAIISARIPELIYAAKDLRYGSVESFLNIKDYNFNHKINIKGEILSEESRNMIKGFFKNLREEKNINSNYNKDI